MTDVLFQYRPQGRPQSVDIRGDIVHWNATTPMERASNGCWQAQLSLPTGVYEYKYRHAGDEWVLDPANPRTRCRDGARNSVVVVGGTDEPVLHAPAAPFVVGYADGRVCIRAGLRHGFGRQLRLSFDEGVGFVEQAMVVVATEAEHTIFETQISGTGRSVAYVFHTDGGVVGSSDNDNQPFVLQPRDHRHEAPSWWPDAVVYSIFVDRFRRGGTDGTWVEPDRWDRDHLAGGDLNGIAEALPYLSDLGVTVLHLTPICEAPSPHRYDGSAPRTVAANLGGETAFTELLSRAEALGIRIVVDVTLTHVHRDFFAFRDVRERGPKSPYWDWFHVYSHPFTDGQRPGYQHYQKGQWREPLLRLDHPEVADYVVGTFEYWVGLGAHGVRVDAAADVPPALLRRIKTAVCKRNPAAVVFGEVIPANSHRWTGDALHAATDFAFTEALRSWLCGETDSDMLEYVRCQRQLQRGGPDWTALSFTSTHDQSRLATQTRDVRLARLGQLAVVLRAGVPMLYYGDEVGLQSDAPPREFEDAWPDRQCMPWQSDDWDTDSHTLIRDLLSLRRRLPALRGGGELPLPYNNTASPDVFGFRRRFHGQVVDVIVNRSAAEAAVDIGPEPAALAHHVANVAVSGTELQLGPYAAAVIERSIQPDYELLDNNKALCRAAQQRGLSECPAYPARLYLTVTETCNLRCAHCITNAPELTRQRRSRTIQPWLIHELAPAFAAADYFGFVHGGESLTTPIFDDVLRAIDRAHQNRSGRYDVHLASNAMLLDGERARTILDLGVTSIMVSLDGASAATNDIVRLGSRFDRIIGHVQQLIALREQRGYDVRIGLSTVVGATNIHEAHALASLAANLGVDWLKVEETYPANEFARGDQLAMTDPRLIDALAAISAELNDTEVVLVNHLDPPSGCVCDSPSPSLREFRAADDYANRFDYCQCRAAWEQACIDPDGTVHQVDYGHPALGSVLNTPLLELWNTPTAQRVRAGFNA